MIYSFNRSCRTVWLCLLLSCGKFVSAQLSGTYNIPTDFPSIAAAISGLNTQGVSAPVIIEINAGYTETAPVGGYLVNAITGASLVNSITFQKTGSGPNPLIMAYGGGTATPTSAIQDGIWRFAGTDFVTIDGIDLLDLNPANPATMEFGYGFYKTGPADGCQYNTIKNCTITLNRINAANGSGASLPGSKGISFANSTYALNLNSITVSNNTGTNSYNRVYNNLIRNCQIGVAVAGYSLTTNTSLYDTGNDIGGTSAATGNTIIDFGGGGTGAIASAIYTTAQFVNNISFNAINNNTGSGINHPYILYGIYNFYNGKNAVVTINNNTLTIQGGGSAQTTGAIENIENSSGILTNSVTINYNVVQNCTYTTSTGGGFLGIRTSGSAANVTAFQNLVTNVTTAGSANLLYISGGKYTSILSNTVSNTNCTNGAAAAIQCADANDLLTDNNLVENIKGLSIDGIYTSNTVASYTASSNVIRNLSILYGGKIYGIREMGAASGKLLQNNQIYNFSVTATGTGGGNFYGMYCYSGSVTATGNTIYSLNSSGANGSNNVFVYGILATSGQSVDINKNKIYGLSCASPKGFVSGISVNLQGMVSNNLVGGLSNVNAVSGTNITGIELTNGNNKVYHNSVYLNALTSSSLSGTSALMAGSGVDLRNNICVNVSTPAGSGITCAYRKVTTAFVDSTRNNLFYAGTPSPSRVICNDFTTSYQTLAAYQAAAGLRDIFSVTENPPFLSTAGASSNFLAISPTPTTQVESGGTPVASVPNDYNGTARNTVTPDIGAWEGNYNGVDISAPGIFSYGFTNPSTCSTSSRSFTVALGDLSGIASGTLSPRVYYKINSGAYVSTGGVLSAGTATNGVWTFNLSYSASPTNVISFYVVAQDILSNPVMAYPVAGFSGTDVNTILTPPGAPLTYTITYTLNGSYSVGPGGNFTTLSQAAAAYNSACITGPVEFLLTGTLYSFSETFPITFAKNMAATATNSLLIKPFPSTAVTISGSTASTAVLKFLDARYITLDGINTPGTSLKLVNNTTNWSSAGAAIWLANGGPGCTDLAIRNTLIYGASTTTISSRGISAGSDGIAVSVAGALHTNISIEGNTFLKAYTAIFAHGSNSWKIKNNVIGASVAGTDEVGGVGIDAYGTSNLSIKENLIRRISGVQNMACGILLDEDNVLASVSQNTIQSISFNSGTSSTYGFSAAGIYVGYNCRKTTLSANSISNISSTYNNGGVRGISFLNNISYSDTNYVYNNMISGIYAKSGALIATWPAGIEIANCYNVYTDNNSISLSGTYTGTTGVSGSAAMITRGSNNNLRIRNTIFSNTLYNSAASTSTVYALYSTSIPTYMTFDYNTYYVSGSAPNKFLAYSNAVLNTLPAIQSTMGGNLNSNTLTPVFTSSTDLHLSISAGNLPFENLGSPLPYITTDIDADPRNPTTPDIGADEFTIPLCTGANSGTLASTPLQACPGQTISIAASGADPGIDAGYQWMVSSTAGGPYTVVATGSGAAATGYTLPVLPAGTYYYTLNGTCGSSTVVSTSNEATVTIHPRPVISLGGGSICTGQTFTLVAGGASTYTYSSVSNTVSPTTTTTYSASGTSAQGCVSNTVGVATVTVNPLPVIAFSGTTVCLNSTVTVNVSGVISYTWSNGTINTGMAVSPVTNTTYSVSGENSNGCFKSASVTVSVIPLPSITLSGNTVSCAGSAITQTATGASTYTWSNGHVGPTNTISPVSTTIYTVTGTNNTTGCTNTVTRTITVNALPIVTANTNSTVICAGTPVTLYGGGANTYTWTGGVSNLVPFSPALSGSYSVTGTDANGCKNSASISLTVNPKPSVHPVSSASLICTGNSATLTANGGVQYQWSNGSQTPATVVSPTVTTAYSVTVTAATGCSTGTTITQYVSPCTSVSSMQPLSSGFNVYPNPTTGDVYIEMDAALEDGVATIYNSLGQLVYSAALHSSLTVLDLRAFSNGIYLLQISQHNRVIRQEKIVKQ